MLQLTHGVRSLAELRSNRLRAAVDVVLRRWLAIAVLTGSVVALASIWLATTTPYYTASARVLFDTRKQDSLGMDAIVSRLPLDASSIASEIEVIRSRSLLRRVVRNEGLAQSPGVVHSSWLDWFTQLWAPNKGAGSNDSAANLAAGDSPEIRRAIDQLLGTLDVRRVGLTYVMAISVTARSPTEAARLANAIAEAYLVDQLEAKYEAARRANAWLSERLEEIRARVGESEEALAAFRAQNNLVGTRSGTLAEQQLSELNAQLVLARADLTQRQAKLEQAERLIKGGGNLASIAEVLQSPVIANLRAQQTEFMRREADLSQRYADQHPNIINLRTQRRDLERQVEVEINRIVNGLRNDYEVARKRAMSLETGLKELTDHTGSAGPQQARLKEFERIAEVNRALYDNYLARFRQTEAQTTLERREARIVSAATPPMNPSFPRTRLVLALALMFGLALGTAAAFTIESFRSAITSAEQVEELLHIPVLAIVPLLNEREVPARKHQLDSPATIILENPLSRFSEACHALRTSLRLSNKDVPPKVIMVCSALPGEGKSTLALGLAMSAAQSGQKTLFIDCDLRRPSATVALGRKAEPGLVDFLLDQPAPQGLIRIEPESGLHVISAGSATRNPTDLLESEKLVQMFSELRKRYDLITVDSPPILAVVDTLALLPLVDKALFVIQWDSTPIAVVRRSLDILGLRDKVAGVALNKFDMRRAFRYSSYEHYYYNYYGQSLKGSHSSERATMSRAAVKS